MLDSPKCAPALCYLSRSIPLTVGWMIGLGTVNGFLGLNNRSYWPHLGDNTFSSFCPCLCLSFTLCHIHTQSGGEMAYYVFIDLWNLLYISTFSAQNVTVFRATEICNSSTV